MLSSIESRSISYMLSVGSVGIAILFSLGTALGQQSANWPDGTALLMRHDALVRGRFDTAAHQTRYTLQHMDVAPHLRVTVEKFSRKPAELVQKMTGSDGSIVINGYDGSRAWEVRDGVARLLTGYEADALKQSASFYDGLLEPTAASRIRNAVTVGEGSVDGDTVFAVSGGVKTLAEATASGMPVVYISKATGLVTSLTLGGADKPFFSRQVFGAYRSFGGMLVPTEWTITSRSGSTEFTHSVEIDDVRWDSVPEGAFELPPEVRALIKP